ncbi:MAG TPA: hypothetical protein VNO70_03040 [Blastocatellia bacterium]|nr:hypothetical protein [Blastocatellia bacterium]
MATTSATSLSCERALRKLLGYCRSESWAGYDPYDGLNSPLARFIPTKFARTALTQFVKRCPVNVRPLLGIRKDLNPKGLALAASAIALLAKRYAVRLPSQVEHQPVYRPPAADDLRGGLRIDFEYLMSALESLRSKGYEEACWGYNFDWQSRAFFAPRGTPNVVCTVFAAHAYLDWHAATGNEAALATAISSCRFLLDRLNRSQERDGFCFSYTPLDCSQAHNVNLLAAELLARVYEKNREEEFREAALSATRYTLARQRDDGSWPYGEARSQGWIDSFHTGFVLVSLKRLMRYLGEAGWRAHLERGYEFYAQKFFLADSTPKYYHETLYPVDAHSAAQAVITFVEMTGLMPDAEQKADDAVNWAIGNMQDADGYFYFQRHRLYTNKIPFMRWSQTWMLYALSLYLAK